MSNKKIPAPTCETCGESSGDNYTSGETSYLCLNCGTEMRYLPAGQLLASGGGDMKKNSGWITTFSVFSSELYSGRAMFAIGVLIIVLTLSFLFLGKLEPESALWCSGSGGLLVFLGLRKLAVQKKKVKMVTARYPYWEK